MESRVEHVSGADFTICVDEVNKLTNKLYKNGWKRRLIVSQSQDNKPNDFTKLSVVYTKE